jgi:anti-sigma-K factor RskA
MNLLDRPELTDRLAAAYALGTLRGGARRRFETIARHSPAVRAQVIIWQERFAALTELQPAGSPSSNVWKRIENLLPAQSATAPAGASAPAASAVLERLGRLLSLWRGVALASGTVAIVMAVIGSQLNTSLQREQAALADAGRQRDEMSRQVAELSAQMRAMPEIQYVAVLADDRQAPMLLATFDTKQRMLTLKRVAPMSAGPDRSLQLWAVPPGAAPRSLGVLGDDQVVRLAMPELPTREMPALAVSLEPKGGAPQGSGPTGPVMYKGALLRTAT